MSEIGLIIAIALPISLILIGIVWMGRRQQSNEEARLKAQVIKKSADDLTDALEFLIKHDDYREIQQHILSRVVVLYHTAQETLPKQDIALVSALNFDAEYYEKMMAEGNKSDLLFKSDRDLYLAKRYFGQIIKALNQMNNKGELGFDLYNEYVRHLRMSLLNKEVDSYIESGNESAKRGDVLTATNYFKAAKKLLIEFDLSFPDKNERIRALTQRTVELYSGNIFKKDAHLSEMLGAEEKESMHGIPANPLEKKRF
ncbi:MAG: hypothetical protein WAO12_05385 [Venatoribacter sp.]